MDGMGVGREGRVGRMERRVDGGGGKRELTVSRPRVKVPTNFRLLVGHTIVGRVVDVSSRSGIAILMEVILRRGSRGL